MNDWLSAYAITSNLPPVFYRELARLAGVHIYNEKDDSFYINRSYITLNADGQGIRTIKLPHTCDVINPLTNEKIYKSVKQFTKDMKDKETLLLRYESDN
jgi:hypothetical protein